MRTHSKRKTPEAIAARVEVARRGWNAPHIGKLIGVDHRQVKNVICGNDASWPIRRKIEDLLGLPLWSDLDEFLARQSTNRRTPKQNA